MNLKPPVYGPLGLGGKLWIVFQAAEKGLFYPQIAHTLCISHTDPLWTAWNEWSEFFEICGTLCSPALQISSNSRRPRLLPRLRRTDTVPRWAEIRRILRASTLPGAADFKKSRPCQRPCRMDSSHRFPRGTAWAGEIGELHQQSHARTGRLDRCSKLMDSLPCYRPERMVSRVPC